MLVMTAAATQFVDQSAFESWPKTWACPPLMDGCTHVEGKPGKQHCNELYEANPQIVSDISTQLFDKGSYLSRLSCTRFKKRLVGAAS